ncbi:SDR family oxidoreductase [Rhodobacteraceae bacterium ASV31]|nr:SDR family oxidoreductase [Anianabacter salinae]
MHILSASSRSQFSNAFAHSSAQVYIRHLVEYVARQWAVSGGRLNTFRPGFFPTIWNREHFITPEREAAALGHTSMKRYGGVAELVGAFIWSFSNVKNFVREAEVAFDGGYSAMTI